MRTEGQGGSIVGFLAWLLHKEVFALFKECVKGCDSFLDVSYALIFRTFLSYNSIPGANCYMMVADELLMYRKLPHVHVVCIVACSPE